MIKCIDPMSFYTSESKRVVRCVSIHLSLSLIVCVWNDSVDSFSVIHTNGVYSPSTPYDLNLCNTQPGNLLICRSLLLLCAPQCITLVLQSTGTVCVSVFVDSAG